MRTIRSSGLKTSSALLYTGRGRLVGVDVIPDGTNQAVAAITDGSGGTALAKGTGKVESVHIPCGGVEFHAGIYLTISGTGAGCIVRYEEDK